MKCVPGYILVCLILCSLADRSFSASQSEELELLLKKAATLRREYTMQQDLLQEATEQRWARRQGEIEQKSENKMAIEQLRQEIERLYTDVARMREVQLGREKALDAERNQLDEQKRAWGYVQQAVQEKLEKTKEDNLRSFPLGQDERIGALNDIEYAFGAEKSPSAKLNYLVSFVVESLEKGARISFSRETIIVGNDTPVDARVLRVGSCMAYGMDTEGTVYYLSRSSGIASKNAFTWTRVRAEEFARSVRDLFPAVMEEKKIAALLPVDILQNRYSTALVEGERESWKGRIITLVQAGGFIMLPLGVILVWGFVLVFERLFAYRRNRKKEVTTINEALALLEKDGREAARAIASGKQSVLMRILGRCLDSEYRDRDEAEKAVMEQLLAESPHLDKHLNTLAVLAAAAPLLGLLGTVTGMISMFDAITKFGTGDPRLLAGGISEALITTQAGLAIAIPLLLLHNFIRNRRNAIQGDMEMYAMKILNHIWKKD